MELITMQPAASPESWRLFVARKTDPAFTNFAQQILERDANTCQFCGFQSTKYQEIINLDHNYRNNNLDNLATACPLCAQCFFLESVGKSDEGGGILIYLPELTQAELSGICHALFSAIANENNSDDAQSLYRTLKLRAKVVEKYLGEAMSDPTTLGQLIIEATTANDTDAIKNLIKDLRLLPSREKFGRYIREWLTCSPDYSLN